MTSYERAVTWGSIAIAADNIARNKKQDLNSLSIQIDRLCELRDRLRNKKNESEPKRLQSGVNESR